MNMETGMILIRHKTLKILSIKIVKVCQILKKNMFGMKNYQWQGPLG